MLKRFTFRILFLLFLMTGNTAFCQQISDTLLVESSHLSDSGSTKNPLQMDTLLNKKFNPRTATIRSAILPGWGQAYNKKYWKIPIVYGALGVSAGFFFSNLKTYKELRQAVILKSDGIPGNDTLISPELQNLPLEALRVYRNTFRQYVDYSVLVFLVFWGLNVVDATVDAHLKSFDVSPDLSFKIRPGYQYATGNASVSLVFFFKERSKVSNLPH